MSCEGFSTGSLCILKRINELKILLISSLLLLLLGCAAAGVPYTNDPTQKLVYAYSLMNQGRALPAERLGKEALDSFKEANNQFGEAEAHIFLGQLYKHNSYRAFSEHFKKNGDYDPTNGKSIAHTAQAIEIYEALENHMQLAKAKFALANTYISTKPEKSCKLYDESLREYEKGKAKNPNQDFTINPAYKSFEDMVSGFKSEYCSA